MEGTWNPVNGACGRSLATIVMALAVALPVPTSWSRAVGVGPAARGRTTAGALCRGIPERNQRHREGPLHSLGHGLQVNLR